MNLDKIDKAKGLPHLEVPLEVLEQIAVFFDDAIDSITDDAADTNDTAHNVV